MWLALLVVIIFFHCAMFVKETGKNGINSEFIDVILS
jgi:hypothetical protein